MSELKELEGPPAEAGWYWFRCLSRETIVRVWNDCGCMVFRENPNSPTTRCADKRGEWFGPIPEPPRNLRRPRTFRCKCDNGARGVGCVFGVGDHSALAILWGGQETPIVYRDDELKRTGIRIIKYDDEE